MSVAQMQIGSPEKWEPTRGDPSVSPIWVNRDGPECQAGIFRGPKFRLQPPRWAPVNFLSKNGFQARLRPSEREAAGARGLRKSPECEAIRGKFKLI